MTINLDLVFAKLAPQPVTLTMNGNAHTLRPLTRDELAMLDTLGTPADGETNDQLNARALTFVRSLFDVPPPIFPESLPTDPQAAHQALLDAAAGLTAVYRIAHDQWNDVSRQQRAMDETRRQLAEQRPNSAA